MPTSLRESLAFVVAELKDAEVSAQIGAGLKGPTRLTDDPGLHHETRLDCGQEFSAVPWKSRPSQRRDGLLRSRRFPYWEPLERVAQLGADPRSVRRRV